MRLGPDRVIACPQCEAPLRAGTLLSFNTANVGLWTDGACAPLLAPTITQCAACRGFFWLENARVLGQVELDATPASAPPGWRTAALVEHLAADALRAALEAGAASGRIEETALRLMVWQADNRSLRAGPVVRHTGIGCLVALALGGGVLIFTSLGYAVAVLIVFASIFYGLSRFGAASRWRRLVAERARDVASSSSAFRMNLNALSLLLDDQVIGQALLKAEIARELGEFETADRLLADLPSGEGVAEQREERLFDSFTGQHQRVAQQIRMFVRMRDMLVQSIKAGES